MRTPKWSAIFCISVSLWMKAIIFICSPHLGQTSGSTSYIFLMQRAQLEVVGVLSESVDWSSEVRGKIGWIELESC